jgi:hypothetical protein
MPTIQIDEQISHPCRIAVETVLLFNLDMFREQAE